MLQDTDFFKQFPGWSSIGDVHARVEWSESPTPDERYTVFTTWRFRSKIIGSSEIIIEPVLNTDEFRVLWINIEFVSEWRDKGLYSLLVQAYMDNMPAYGVTSFVGAPVDKTAEAIYKATGFEWEGFSFVLRLTGDRIKEWRAYKDGKTEQPKWRHAALAEAGLLDRSEAI